MAKSQRKPSPPTSFELLGLRVQKAMVAPSVQRRRTLVIFKEDHESAEDWSQLIEAIGDTDGVRTRLQEDGGVYIQWDQPALA